MDKLMSVVVDLCSTNVQPGRCKQEDERALQRKKSSDILPFDIY